MVTGSAEQRGPGTRRQTGPALRPPGWEWRASRRASEPRPPHGGGARSARRGCRRRVDGCRASSPPSPRTAPARAARPLRPCCPDVEMTCCVSRGRAVPSLPSRRAPRPSQGALWRQGGPGGKKGIDGVKSKTVCGPRRRGTRSATTARSLLVLIPRPRCPLPALLRVLARHPCTPELPARRRGLPTPRPAPGLRL